MAIGNRLQLDFTLVTDQERADFLNKYLQQPQFIKRPPTAEELETMANYLLWGKDPVTGLNAKQAGIVDIETKHSTWSKNSSVESLEGLMEQPQFNEASLHPLDQVPLRAARESFSRKEALAQCPDYMVSTFTDLFARIDYLDLVLNCYDLAHGKRKTPIRPALLNKFSPEELAAAESEAASLTQPQYLKRRHMLVDLRREQYILRDQYAEPVQLTDIPMYNKPIEPPMYGVDIPVLPLGLRQTANEASRLVFLPKHDLIPEKFSQEELTQISDLYWATKKADLAPTQLFFDFREHEHVYQALLQLEEMEDAADPENWESTLPHLLDTMNFYVEMAELDEVQREIYDLKVERRRNADIASIINSKWGKSYTPNYVSTIFRQKIIPKINEAARYHEKVVSNLFFEEEFKRCKDCGRVFLLDPCNFTRSARSKDGFAIRCKACEKLKRKRSE